MRELRVDGFMPRRRAAPLAPAALVQARWAQRLESKPLADSLAAVVGATYTLQLCDDREFTVMFRRDDGPAIEAEPLKHIVPAEPGDLYFVTIRLIEV